MEKTMKLDGVTPEDLKWLFIHVLNLTHLEGFWAGCAADWEFEDRTEELENAVAQAFRHACESEQIFTKED